MEYYEDLHQFYQDCQSESFNYYTLELDGAEYAQGTYEDCEYEREEFLKKYGKLYGVSRSDFQICSHSCSF